jgi:hypothetical protein
MSGIPGEISKRRALKIERPAESLEDLFEELP